MNLSLKPPSIGLPKLALSLALKPPSMALPKLALSLALKPPSMALPKLALSLALKPPSMALPKLSLGLGLKPPSFSLALGAETYTRTVGSAGYTIQVSYPPQGGFQPDLFLFASFFLYVACYKKWRRPMIKATAGLIIILFAAAGISFAGIWSGVLAAMAAFAGAGWGLYGIIRKYKGDAAGENTGGKTGGFLSPACQQVIHRV